MDTNNAVMHKCPDIGKKYFSDIKGDAWYCKAKEEGRLNDCSKSRLKGDITPACWKVLVK